MKSGTKSYILPKIRPAKSKSIDQVYNSQIMRTKPTPQDSSFDSHQCLEGTLSSDTPINPDGFRHKRRSRWTPGQNIRYAQFLKENINYFKDNATRKRQKVFCKLAIYMGTRSKSQAKSHHQKMRKRHRQVQKIIEYIETNYSSNDLPKIEVSQSNDQKFSKQCQTLEKKPFQPVSINQNTDENKFEQPQFAEDSRENQFEKGWFEDF